ncbi:MAG: hypothetical protein IPM25_08525 [Chloracidobacterium sp.]|nr:hypothetical protein [Chloracidobacterium sp.]
MKLLIIKIMFAAMFGAVAVEAHGQAPAKARPGAASASYKTTAAYAEIGLRKAELESELEALLVDYTEEFPKVKDLRQTLAFLKKGEERLAAASPEPAARFTAALGKLVVRKAELEADLARLSENFQPTHPDVRRARRKVEVFDAAIKEILG